MRTRWLLAALAAAAFVVLATWLPFRWSDADSSESIAATNAGTSEDAVCGPNSPKANLDFTLKDMDGKSVNLADFKGKVVLLNFWATWCAPCLAEIPGFVDLQARYRGEGLVIVGISVDDPIEKLKPLAQEFKMNYPVLAGVDENGVQDAFGPLLGIPVSVLISRNGLVCKKFIGGASRQQFEREIRALL